jgi:CheY-like chemotaxis protein
MARINSAIRLRKEIKARIERKKELLKLSEELKKANQKLEKIALTAYALDSDKERALSEGFDDHLTKPLKKDKLFEMIEKYI